MNDDTGEIRTAIALWSGLGVFFTVLISTEDPIKAGGVAVVFAVCLFLIFIFKDIKGGQ